VTERVEAALAPLGLTMTRYEVLGLIESAGGRMTLRDLKRATMLHAATMTGTINALEERRLLRRELDADNRRVVVAVLTDKGATVARRAMAALSTAQFGLPDLSEDEALHIAECVARVGRTTSPA
jgi:DNA-binding MarR family transcriptional regulator